jgi:hypothetical protein
VHHAGWVGPNPKGYTTWFGFHSWIDSGLIAKAGITKADLLPRAAPVEPYVLGTREDGRDPFFVIAMDHVIAQNALVEPLYRMEKAGLLGNSQQPKPVAPEARAFIEGQLLTGAQILARTWVTAWRSAPVDTFLRTQLAKRQEAAVAKPAK